MFPSVTSYIHAMNQTELQAAYARHQPTFSRTARNVAEAIGLSLAGVGLQPITIQSRVKTFESFIEKINRKGYTKPFQQTTDFVGIRVVLPLPRDIRPAEEVIDCDFRVLESHDKASNLALDQFGYRSHHMLIRIPETWTVTPNYRGLAHIDIEVQLRTVLMHAWADIEHMLQYKASTELPPELTRRLSAVSSVLETADMQFSDIIEEVNRLRAAAEPPEKKV